MAHRVDYHRYMASREWALKKNAIKDRAAGCCERCLLETSRLQVHHLTYEHLGDERPEELQALCRWCHEYESGKHGIDPKDAAAWLFYMDFDLRWMAMQWGWDWPLAMLDKYGHDFAAILSQAALDYDMVTRANRLDPNELADDLRQCIERSRRRA